LIPVNQTKFGYGQGNCAAACIASIFERDIENIDLVHAYNSDIMKWTRDNRPDLDYHNIDLAQNFRAVDGFPECEFYGTQRYTYDLPDSWQPPTLGFWMASVYSPGLKRPVEDAYYPLPGLHAVVFQGDKLAHDPNPAYADLPNDRYDDQMVMMTWWEKATEGDDGGS